MKQQQQAYKTIHFFGEMDLDLSNTPRQVYKKAFYIAEACGYSVDIVQKTKNRSAHILILGEDTPDNLQMESILNYENEEFTSIQKVLYKISYEGLGRDQKQVKKILKAFEFLGGEFVETFDQQKHEIDLKGHVQYQQALARENKKDHPLYTGNGVEQRNCTCISGDKCPYYACVNCKSTDITYENYSHCCQKCNRLQDVTVLEPFIICEKHGKFSRDEGECPKCLA
jgi:hypothetical protein